ncbi:flagellar protein FlhE [Erwinia amylovora]|uniref:Flagellar protein FlhE n=4 Tax=Erwinia amylovora TaxID=552 RepID=A0A831A3B8_ERWAM|nr:flagellar protein FlhE [Erwinia amylovora]CBX81584.1 Flagellar protein FlhE precursor [Erwinia amylovora ATCC BAA-2158]CDK16092.1 Flagellar protein FlhE precursor [Erwinia amylovora LA635]CDK19459.1 Flagellar protein FlhE precursor [Erwinia amylovora LA636]CDK22830.1 Flagellar protein FlhE precursor [Erwinia amylovora LA637]ATZ12359.1 flagellar protein FlhE [Erwinia amylovora]
MKSALPALLLMLPIAVHASHGGAWSSQSFGGVISRGQQEITSRPLQPGAPLPASATAARVAWRITPDSAPPPDLKITLCSRGRCMALPALAGEQTLPSSFPADGPFRFIYSTVTRGSLQPALTILSNQLTVNYRTGALLR